MSPINRLEALKITRSYRWFPCLLGGLALGGAAMAGQDGLDGAAAKAAAAPVAYRVTQLGGDLPVAMKINASGQVAFTQAVDISSPFHSWFYDGKHVREIISPGSTSVRVTGLNDLGQVTGEAIGAGGNPRGFVWSRAYGIRDLGTLPGATETRDPIINNHGVVAGISRGDPLPHAIAFRWTPTTGIQSLGALTTGEESYSFAWAINDEGTIAGDTLAPRGAGTAFQAFVWTRATGMVDIDTLDNDSSSAVAISARGLVAGNYLNAPDNINQAFVWTRRHGMHALGTGAGIGAYVAGMSSGGRIAGAIEYPGFEEHAMTWTREGGMVELGTLGGSGSLAIAANNRAQVVGVARTPGDADIHAFAWNPKDGLVDLNTRLRHAPAGLVLYQANGINDKGAIVADSNAGTLLLTPDGGPGHGHVSGPIASPGVVHAGTEFVASLGFAAEDAASHKVTWSWGDGSGAQAGQASERNGDGSASGSHVYTAPGIYTVTATVAGQDGESTTVSRRIAVLDPAGRFVGGTGSFVAGSPVSRKAAFGPARATFSFVAPATAQATTDNSKAGLSFHTAGLGFRSTDIRLVDMQGTRAQFAGSGELNGKGGYRFAMATTAGVAAGTGEPGRFSLKIWHTDPVTKAEVVDYDTQAGASGAAGRALVEGKIAVQ
jgi:probable HAF family extracellular repeat protein